MSAIQSPVRPMCRHCKKNPVTRPRGLCWPCYYTPGVKALFPSTSKYARRSNVPNSSVSPLPPFPTDAKVGSEAKMQIMAIRAALGQALHHPEDNLYVATDRRPSQDYRIGSDKATANRKEKRKRSDRLKGGPFRGPRERNRGHSTVDATHG